jgi:hypothetical protein
MMDSLETRLRDHMRKWISQANHPMRAGRPEERDLILRHVEQLRTELENERRGYLDE